MIDNPYVAVRDEDHGGWLWDDRLPCEPLEQIMPPLTTALLAAAGRILAAHARFEAALDDPFTFGGSATVVFAALPAQARALDRNARTRFAAAFDGLTDDLTAGRAPMPRTVAEALAFELMVQAAPQLLVLSDGDLAVLGVVVPRTPDEVTWAEFCWETILETFSVWNADDCFGDEDLDVVNPGRADDIDQPTALADLAVTHWFTTFNGLHPRPANNTAARRDGRAGEIGLPRRLSACPLLRLRAEDRLTYDAYDAYTDDFRHHCETPELAEYITPVTARLLAYAGRELAYGIYWDAVQLKDGPYIFDDFYGMHEGLGVLPRVCDHQDLAWRLQMARCFADLADDLTAGRAPLPRTTGEEVALKLMVDHVTDLVDDLRSADAGDADMFAGYGLTPGAAPSARHLRFDRIMEVCYQDWDVLALFDADELYMADATHPAVLAIGAGDLHPSSWFTTFSNLRPRDPDRGYDDWVWRHLKPELQVVAAVVSDAADPAETRALATLTCGYLKGTATGTPVRAGLLLRPGDLDPHARDLLRDHIDAIVEPDGEAGLFTPVTVQPGTRRGALTALRPSPVGRQRADRAIWWLLPAPVDDPTLSTLLLDKHAARQGTPTAADSGYHSAVAFHDQLVGTRLARSVAAMLVAAPRTLWDETRRRPYEALGVAVVCRDGREIYAAPAADGTVRTEVHDHGPPTASLDRVEREWARVNDPARRNSLPEPQPLHPSFQDLATAVARSCLGRPGDPHADTQTLVHVAALAWLRRIAEQAQLVGPVTQQQAAMLQPAVLRAVKALPDAADYDPDDQQLPDLETLWRPVWEMLAAGEAIVPGMAPADAAWRDPGTAAQRIFTWAGDAEAAYIAFDGARAWFTTPRQATVVDTTLSELGII